MQIAGQIRKHLALRLLQTSSLRSTARGPACVHVQVIRVTSDRFLDLLHDQEVISTAQMRPHIHIQGGLALAPAAAASCPQLLSSIIVARGKQRISLHRTGPSRRLFQRHPCHARHEAGGGTEPNLLICRLKPLLSNLTVVLDHNKLRLQTCEWSRSRPNPPVYCAD